MSKFEETSGCWIWKGRVGQGKDRGYGNFSAGTGPNRKILVASRVAYEVFIGPIPDGMLVCHACDNRACVNPSHLFLGTHKDNMRDMVQKNRRHVLRNPKLTEAQVLEIRAATGLHREIATNYGIAKSAVSMIKSRKIWAHLP